MIIKESWFTFSSGQAVFRWTEDKICTLCHDLQMNVNAHVVQMFNFVAIIVVINVQGRPIIS